MLVVTNEGARAVGRQGGFAGARQAEENRRVAAGADIGRAMHRQHALGRQQEVQNAEHRFFDLAGVPGAADQHQAALEIDQHKGAGIDAVLSAAGFQARHLNDGEPRLEVGQFGGRRLNEHIACEEIMPGGLGDHPDRQAEGRVGASVAILHENLAPLQIGGGALVQNVERLGGDRSVNLAPVDIAAITGVIDDEFVIGRAPGVLTGGHREGAAGGDGALATANRFLIQLALGEVPMSRPQIAQTAGPKVRLIR